MMELDNISTEDYNGKKKRCKFCGNDHVWGRKNCPAFGKTCTKCGGMNHFKKACLKFNEKVNMIPEDDGFEIH